MPTLLDVNVLLPLVAQQHECSEFTTRWFDSVPDSHCIVCRVAQLGLLRLLNNPIVLREEALPAQACWDVWTILLQDRRIRYDLTEPEGLDDEFRRLTSSATFHPKLWTDAYLAAFATAAGYTLTTFDRGMQQFPGLNLDLLTPTS